MHVIFLQFVFFDRLYLCSIFTDYWFLCVLILYFFIIIRQSFITVTVRCFNFVMTEICDTQLNKVFLMKY